MALLVCDYPEIQFGLNGPAHENIRFEDIHLCIQGCPLTVMCSFWETTRDIRKQAGGKEWHFLASDTLTRDFSTTV